MKKLLAIALAGLVTSGTAAATVSGHYYNFPLHDGTAKVFVVEKVDARTNEVIETKYFPVDPACIDTAADGTATLSEVAEESSADHNGVDISVPVADGNSPVISDERSTAISAAIATTGLVLSVQEEEEVGFWKKAASFLTSTKIKLEHMANQAAAKYEQLTADQKPAEVTSSEVSDAPVIEDLPANEEPETPKPEVQVAEGKSSEDLVK